MQRKYIEVFQSQISLLVQKDETQVLIFFAIYFNVSNILQSFL